MTPQQLSTNRRPLIIGHRGASGRALENSLAAFRLAGEEGCDGVELDVHLSRDGELIVHHDPEIPGGESIAALSLAEIRVRPLGDGHPAPTLAEVLAATAGLDVYIEAKTLPAEADARLLELIRADPTPARLHVHAFDHRIIARLARQAPLLSLGVLSASYPIDPIGPARDAGANTLWQARDLIDASLVARCREAGIAVIAWTVNDATEAARLTALGVAGLCGNWPDRLRAT
jgi:glycerophosphoryl diester phosphodiesterase